MKTEEMRKLINIMESASKPRSRHLNEDRQTLSIKRKELGQVPLKNSKLSDPHIRDLVNKISAKTGIPTFDLDNKIQEDVAKLDELKKYSPILYTTIAQNAVENAAFNLMEKSPISGNVQFSMPVFYRLCEMIQMEHPQ